MKNIIHTITSTYPVSDEALAAFQALLVPCRFAKREQIVRVGGCCRSVYFIEQGMTRHYWIVDGSEITTSFSVEGGALFSMDEVYYNRPSEEFIEAIEDVTAYRISIANLNHLYETYLDWANWGRVVHQNEYRRLHRSHKELITLSARERYEAFVRQFPEVMLRANLGYIASYLGITRSTLSRLRGQK